MSVQRVDVGEFSSIHTANDLVGPDLVLEKAPERRIRYHMPIRFKIEVGNQSFEFIEQGGSIKMESTWCKLRTRPPMQEIY